MLTTMRVLQVDIVVPVRNEEHDLALSVRRLVSYLREGFPFTARVTIADNGSTDGTWAVAGRLARDFDEVRAVRIEQPGRGQALRAVWSQSDAEVLAYMDVDLSTDLNALLPLVAPLLSGHSDVAIGTRLARGARVIRGPRRELISRCYNLLLHACMGARFSDAQCGFKAIRRDQARTLLPLTQDTGWFFDTELLVLAERAGLRIHEIPVDWIDDLDSRVDVVATALADLRGMVRLGGGFARGTIKVPQLRGSALAGPSGGVRRAAPGELRLQIASFAVVGIASTIAYVLFYLLLRGVMSAQAANAASLLVTAVANTAANRRLTFGISGRLHAARHQVKGLIAFGIGLALTSGALAALPAHTGRGLEVSVLVVANLVATVIRFVLYRTWVFGKPRADKGEPIERDHLGGEVFDPHPAASHSEPGPAPAARA
jgi:putative flippase GtrA